MSKSAIDAQMARMQADGVTVSSNVGFIIKQPGTSLKRQKCV